MSTEQTMPEHEGTERTRYRAPARDASGAVLAWVSDSARWDDFELRPGDIVISAPAKSGTTWTQMICALLVFQTPDLPAPLTELSPWLDMLVRPISDVRAQLAAQRHRRFIKTHTPLDGIPVDDRVTYLAVGRDPKDVAVSLHHHRKSLAQDVALRLLSPAGTPPVTEIPPPETDVRETFLRWMNDDASPLDDPYTLRALVAHQSQAWTRRDDPNVVLLHYDDLSCDLEAEMRRVAERLTSTSPTYLARDGRRSGLRPDARALGPARAGRTPGSPRRSGQVLPHRLLGRVAGPRHRR
jgi:hypothetical protein